VAREAGRVVGAGQWTSASICRGQASSRPRRRTAKWWPMVGSVQRPAVAAARSNPPPDPEALRPPSEPPRGIRCGPGHRLTDASRAMATLPTSPPAPSKITESKDRRWSPAKWDCHRFRGRPRYGPHRTRPEARAGWRPELTGTIPAWYIHQLPSAPVWTGRKRAAGGGNDLTVAGGAVGPAPVSTPSRHTAATLDAQQRSCPLEGWVSAPQLGQLGTLHHRGAVRPQGGRRAAGARQTERQWEGVLGPARLNQFPGLSRDRQQQRAAGLDLPTRIRNLAGC